MARAPVACPRGGALHRRGGPADTGRVALRFLLVAAALAAALAVRQLPHDAAPAVAAGPPRAPAAARAASVAFDASVEPLNQQAWLAAVARARPEARDLIDRA